NIVPHSESGKGRKLLGISHNGNNQTLSGSPLASQLSTKRSDRSNGFLMNWGAMTQAHHQQKYQLYSFHFKLVSRTGGGEQSFFVAIIPFGGRGDLLFGAMFELGSRARPLSGNVGGHRLV
ncbi:MAG: hypothetical protein ACXW6T_25540, partial [Candidatus Binatia bacterium]